jgi:hypothetical protein
MPEKHVEGLACEGLKVRRRGQKEGIIISWDN